MDLIVVNVKLLSIYDYIVLVTKSLIMLREVLLTKE